MILPGATLGILGGGQLGRMFTVAASTMGYRTIVLDPDPHSPAGQFATEHLCADYRDAKAVDSMAKRCDAVTTEFENVPAATLQALAAACTVRPGAHAVAIAQNRILEKTFLLDNGFPTARFAAIRTPDEMEAGLHTVGIDAVRRHLQPVHQPAAPAGFHEQQRITLPPRRTLPIEGVPCIRDGYWLQPMK